MGVIEGAQSVGEAGFLGFAPRGAASTASPSAEQPAVHGENLPVDEIAGGRGQEHRRAGPSEVGRPLRGRRIDGRGVTG